MVYLCFASALDRGVSYVYVSRFRVMSEQCSAPCLFSSPEFSCFSLYMHVSTCFLVYMYFKNIHGRAYLCFVHVVSLCVVIVVETQVGLVSSYRAGEKLVRLSMRAIET